MNRSLFKVFFLRAFTLTAILTLSVIGAFSQEEKTDSLMSLLRKEKDIDARINILNELHQATYQNNPGGSIAYPREIIIIAQKENLKNKLPNAYQKLAMSYVLLNEIDSAILYLNESISVSKEINDRRGYASATRTLGTAYWYKNDINTAIEHYKKSLQIFEELEDEQQIATTVANLGTAYYVLSDFSTSVDYYQQALDMLDQEKYPDEASSYYNDIGTIYKEWGNRTKALEYFMTALDINNRINNKRYKSANLENIGSIYFEEGNHEMALYYFNEALTIEKEIDNIFGMAQTYVTLSSIHMELSNTDSCFYYLRNALKCYNHVDDKLGLGNTYSKFGEAYAHNKNHERSLNHFNMAVDIFVKIGNEKGLAQAFAGIGNSYYQTGNFERAEEYYIKSVDIALKANIVYLLMNNYRKLAKIFEAKNNSKKEATFLKHYIEIKDTIYQQEKQKQVSELLERFDSERKENEIILLNQQNEISQNRLFRQRVITAAVVVLLILTALGVFLLFTRYRQKKRVNLLLQNKNKEIEEKQIRIEAQNVKLENQAEKLKELDEMKSRFFTNISHEFRTPLTLILGPAELLIERADNPNEKASLMSVKYNAQKLLGLINQLLNISKIEKGMVKMKLSKGNICEHIVFITEMFSSQINEKGLSLEVICNDKPLIGDFDKEKIEHICLNLLSNAIKNTDEGKITVSIMKSEETGWVRIRVSDTGKGIEKKKIPFVFDRFYMADETEKAGSGIGLAFTHELIKVYKGNIFVDSEMGKGTTFTVDLPFSKNAFEPDVYTHIEDVDSQHIVQQTFEAEDNFILKKEKESAKNKNSETILIVEDHSELRTFISDNFIDSYNILEAENGKEGIELALKMLPDFIITDIMMPVVDGIELAKTLKNNEKTSHIPIIMLTAKASEESKISGLETEVDDYLTKPFSIRELRIRIKNILKIRQKLREKYNRSIEVKPSEITCNSIDEQFISKILQLVEENMSNPDFSVETLCELAGISRSALHNKIKSLLNQSTTEFINTIRVKRAAQLIKRKAGSISEIAYDVGFNNLSYFNKVFKSHFHITPKEMMAE